MTPLPERYAALRDRRLLVTGAAGFIGGALFHRLADYGLNPIGSVLHPEEGGRVRDARPRARVPC